MTIHDISFAPDVELLEAFVAIYDEGLVDEQTAQSIYNVIEAVETLREEVTVAIQHLRANRSPNREQVAQLLAAYFSAARSCTSNALGSVYRHADG